MKPTDFRRLCLVLGLLGLVQPLAAAEPFGAPSLLPMPSAYNTEPPYPRIAPANYSWAQEQISPSGQAPQPFMPQPTGLTNDYQQAMKQSWDNACCADSCCQDVLRCRPCPKFAVWGGGLIMDRSNQSDIAMSRDVDSRQTLLGTGDADQPWSGGFEVGAAWIMPNCCNAIAFNFWGLYPGMPDGYLSAPDQPGGVEPAMRGLDELDYFDGTTTHNVHDLMTTTAGAHYIQSTYAFNSLELNFLGNTQAWGLVPFGTGGNCNGCNACGPGCLQMGWLAGFRYFQFDERSCLHTDADDDTIGEPGDINELVHFMNTQNSLWGFQMGGQGAWYVTNCFSFYGNGRFGVFNNHVTSEQFIRGDAGNAYINSGAFTGTQYSVSNSRNVLAGMGQIELGARYQMGNHWSMYGGYRVVGLSGVATAPSQISGNFSDPVTTVNASDSVLLHGAILGAQYAW